MAFFHRSAFVIAFAVRMGEHKLSYLLTVNSLFYPPIPCLTSPLWGNPLDFLDEISTLVWSCTTCSLTPSLQGARVEWTGTYGGKARGILPPEAEGILELNTHFGDLLKAGPKMSRKSYSHWCNHKWARRWWVGICSCTNSKSFGKQVSQLPCSNWELGGLIL